MTQKVAVAVIHGLGKQEPDFADEVRERLKDRFARELGSRGARRDLCVEPVYWAPFLQGAEEVLWHRLSDGGPMDFTGLRRFMVHFAADAVAYQPSPGDRRVYDGIHVILAEALGKLAAAAGPKAPLCIVAHSLGTVIASNYVYDLQVHPTRPILGAEVEAKIGDTPLERGETLSHFYTLGSPLALWSLRFPKSGTGPRFGLPIRVPAPGLHGHWPGLRGEWVNYYDRDDVIGYPLKTLNEAYGSAVTRDVAVSVGSLLTGWNPLSHNGYWSDGDVAAPIASSLAATWNAVNP